MKYQLVIQLAEDSLTFDEIVALEDELIEILGKVGEVDGHDYGCGEVNFFLFTDDPKATFEKCKTILISKFSSTFSCAYRKSGEKDFKILWPLNLKEFKIA